MSIISGPLSGNRSRSSKGNGAKITTPNGLVITKDSDSKSKNSSVHKSTSNVVSVMSNNSDSHNKIPSGTKSGNNIGKISAKGSVISHSQSTRTATIPHSKSSFQGSIISQSKSDTHKSSKGGSVLSGVSSQVAKRKRQLELEKSSNSMKERAMSATSLNRHRSTESRSIESQLQRYSQSEVSVALKTEIQCMTNEERETIVKIIDKYKILENIEKNRKMALNMKIKEIQNLRPTYSDFQSNICYICQRTFWPIIFVKHPCNSCRIFVCKNCLKPYKDTMVCIQCFQEMIYLSKSDLLLKKRKLSDDSDYEENIDVDDIKKIIKETNRNAEMMSNIYDLSVDENDYSSSKTSSPNASLFRKLLNKRKSETLSLTRSKWDLEFPFSDKHSKHPDSVSMKSMSALNASSVLDLAEHGESHVFREGEIMIGLSYNFKTEEFRITIKKCRNLEVAIPNEKASNPYVKVHILPQVLTEKCFKTKTVNSNLNPEFNEHCKYKRIKFDDVISRTVLVTVWHRERLGRDIFLGQVVVKLTSNSLDDAAPQWYKLTDKQPVSIHPTLSKYYGDLQFSIKFNSSGRLENFEDSVDDASTSSCSTGSITLWIKQANNLLTSSYTSLPNAYVKCLLLPESSTVPAKKTPIIRKNFNPSWNIPFPFFNIPQDELSKMGMEITVWDKRPGLIRDIFLGGVSLNISKSGRLVPNNEAEVWQRMIDKPGVWIEAKTILRKNLK